MISIFLMVILSLSAIIWSLPFILFQVFNYRLFKVTDRQKITILSKKINRFSTILVDNERPLGFFFGKWFIGYVMEIQTQRGDTKFEIYMLCRKTQYESMVKSESEIDSSTSEDSTNITIYERSGNFFMLNYMKRTFQVKFTPRPDQQDILDRIKTIYDEKTFATVYISSAPGKGKSMIGLLAAAGFKGSFCKTFNPTDPNDTISNIYANSSPTKTNPLILVLEEVDGILVAIHNGIENHKHIPISVKNKAQWNTMLDDINLGMYPWLIFIMTSNKAPIEINAMDHSYLRDNRVHLKATL